MSVDDKNAIADQILSAIESYFVSVTNEPQKSDSTSSQLIEKQVLQFLNNVQQRLNDNKDVKQTLHVIELMDDLSSVLCEFLRSILSAEKPTNLFDIAQQLSNKLIEISNQFDEKISIFVVEETKNSAIVEKVSENQLIQLKQRT